MDILAALATVKNKAADLPAPIAQAGADLLRSLLGRPCQVAGDLIADQIYSWQWTMRLRIAAMAAKKLESCHVPASVLPPGFLMPLLEACGNTDDEGLQEMWAELLAGAIQSTDVQHPLFVDVLRRMSPKDARLFRALCSGQPIGDTLESDLLKGMTIEEAYNVGIGAAAEWRVPRGRFDLVAPVNHLTVLGVVIITGTVRYGHDEDQFPVVNITPFGREFFQAVASNSTRAGSQTPN